jgi:hypothetical protein
LGEAARIVSNQQERRSDSVKHERTPQDTTCFPPKGRPSCLVG